MCSVNKPSTIVRRAAVADCAVLARLLSDMQAHYRSPDPPGGAIDMARLLTREGERLPFALLAMHQGVTVGFATLSPMLYGGAYQWMLFLKDLYVTEQARGLGVGRTLLAAMARIALDEDYCRIDWTTEGTNHGAQRLYDGLGVPRQDKVFYRLDGEDLRKFAGR
jgi:GNAT superfamily N-acetyltransferase